METIGQSACGCRVAGRCRLCGHGGDSSGVLVAGGLITTLIGCPAVSKTGSLSDDSLRLSSGGYGVGRHHRDSIAVDYRLVAGQYWTTRTDHRQGADQVPTAPVIPGGSARDGIGLDHRRPGSARARRDPTLRLGRRPSAGGSGGAGGGPAVGGNRGHLHRRSCRGQLSRPGPPGRRPRRAADSGRPAAGERVALRSGSNLEFVVALLAASRANLIVVPLDPALPVAYQRARAGAAGARVVLIDGTGPGDRDEPAVRWWPIAVSVARDTGILSVHLDAAGEPTAVASAPQGLRADDAMIMFTGEPRGCRRWFPGRAPTSPPRYGPSSRDTG
ncbi:AMP-binding enzyme family protein [Mycobacterium ulcerans str. Harvey]|uniref:AMP-binding enzyme family protein n=1 Tax=Mycobacterium ulcerans str. Harvey TaxID=1299332 RepID=A0ABN0QM39_MYCUL|nr:AMP-binding enzyme family protein [Mycobacterium ulcerans str. Harvey]